MKKQELLRCLVNSLNFCPKGDVEGLLVEANGHFAQVVFPHETGRAVAKTITIGMTIDFMVEIDSQSREGILLHHVYRFISMDPSETSVAEIASSSNIVAGTVARLNYARHGDANGVVLDSGDFVHLKPDGMRQMELTIGDQIEVDGNVRAMELGGRVIEASSVNGVLLRGKH